MSSRTIGPWPCYRYCYCCAKDTTCFYRARDDRCAEISHLHVLDVRGPVVTALDSTLCGHDDVALERMEIWVTAEPFLSDVCVLSNACVGRTIEGACELWTSGELHYYKSRSAFVLYSQRRNQRQLRRRSIPFHNTLIPRSFLPDIYLYLSPPPTPQQSANTNPESSNAHHSHRPASYPSARRRA